MTVTKHHSPGEPIVGGTRRRGRALPACFVLALALALPACGSSSTGTTNTARATTSAAAASAAPASSSTVTTAASSVAASPSTGDLTGNWQGTADSAAGQDVIDLTVVFAQHDSTLSGTIETDSTCFRRGTISGTNNGATADFTAVSGTMKVTFTASSTGRHMQGTYDAVTSCGSDHGTFELGAA